MSRDYRPACLPTGKRFDMNRVTGIVAAGLLAAVATGLMLVGCSGPLQEVPTGEPGSPPKITASFSPMELGRNDTWRVYIAADDPDGDMFEAVATLNQSAYGYRGASPYRIKKEHRAAMMGYFVVYNRRGGLWVSDGSWLELSVYLMDRAGNKSTTVVFPVVFGMGPKKEPLPAPFNEKELSQLGAFWFEISDPLREIERDRRMR